jgi:uncharacterized protein (TIGR02996 family)
LLAAILAEPERDDVRLVYADWLEEQGEVERGQFVRLQCRIARLDAAAQRWKKRGISQGRFELQQSAMEPLRRCERNLLATHGDDWFRADGGMVPGAPVERNAWMFRPLPSSLTPLRYWLGYERGLLGRFDGSAADWLAHGDDLCQQYPCASVTLTTELDWYAPSTNSDIVIINTGNPPHVIERRCKRAYHGCWWGKGGDGSLAMDHILRAEWPQVKAWHLPA